MLKIVLATLAFAAHAVAFAQATPVGLWKTIDDDTQKEKSLVRIAESGGVLSGKIEKLLDPTAKPDAVCDKCTDERKDKPILGMTILRNLKHNADDAEWWDGGDVVDPNNGKTYKARVRTIEGGKKLQMRGYIGPFYRTQTWVRVE
ncbi:DUF2147 domain-containing protein [Piscinibacter sp.]|uniref:DUF2147 domain-containing protein n=1 Tax=Piscinibacter sp. TaxID=1903157 RepID=UPI002C3848B3|nr:DUF2147 domain-containing protein [Albitalea sp.]HUG21785.1 DUF2147 domain-containing protein [Albitalea sp.]